MKDNIHLVIGIIKSLCALITYLNGIIVGAGPLDVTAGFFCQIDCINVSHPKTSSRTGK